MALWPHQEVRTTPQCSGILMKERGFTVWMPVISSTDWCSVPTVTGCAQPPKILLRFGTWNPRLLSTLFDLRNLRLEVCPHATVWRGPPMDRLFSQDIPTTSSVSTLSPLFKLCSKSIKCLVKQRLTISCQIYDLVEHLNMT